MIHLDAAIRLTAREGGEHGTPQHPKAVAHWISGDCWSVHGTKVEYLGQGKFSVGEKTVEDPNLGAALEYRFRWDPGVLAAVDQLVAGV